MSIKKHINSHNKLLGILDPEIYSKAQFMAQAIADCFTRDGKLYVCGGGLCEPLARYVASIFATKCFMARPPLPAICLNAGLENLSPYENINEIYEKQVNAFLNENDLLWGITADGKSENVLRALRASAHAGIKTIALTGGDSGNIHGLADIYVTTPGKDPVRSRELHVVLIHAICDEVDRIMFNPHDPGMEFDAGDDE